MNARMYNPAFLGSEANSSIPQMEQHLLHFVSREEANEHGAKDWGVMNEREQTQDEDGLEAEYFHEHLIHLGVRWKGELVKLPLPRV